MAVESDIQKLAVDDIVTLFILDATSLRDASGTPGAIHRFCSSTLHDTAVVWQGETYQPFPIEADGFDRTSQGAIPQPTLRVADVSGNLGSLVIAYDDLLGATVTRVRTLKKYLDGEPGADPTAEFPREVYEIVRKLKQLRNMLEFTLGSPFDLQGKKLPGRMVLKQVCTHVYREYLSGSFDYSKATCPYSGTSYYDNTGTATTADKDDCGKRLSDCVLRYPQPNALPTRAFPGVYNVRG